MLLDFRVGTFLEEEGRLGSPVCLKSRPHQRHCRQKLRQCRRKRRQCRRNRQQSGNIVAKNTMLPVSATMSRFLATLSLVWTGLNVWRNTVSGASDPSDVCVERISKMFDVSYDLLGRRRLRSARKSSINWNVQQRHRATLTEIRY